MIEAFKFIFDDFILKLINPKLAENVTKKSDN